MNLNPVDITSVVLAITTVLTSLVIPPILRRRRSAETAEDRKVVSWKGITAVLQQERDRLAAELGEAETTARANARAVDAEHRAEVHALKAEHAVQLGAARDRIKQLEAERNDPAQRLYRQPPTV